MIIDTNKNVQKLEIISTKAADLVDSVKPEKFMIELQRGDGKVEALRANLKSNETMINSIMEEMKNIKRQMSTFKGVEQVVKLNEEVKKELMNIKKEKTTVERHSDKIESIFVEVQKMFQQFNKFPDELEGLNVQFRIPQTQTNSVSS